MGTQISSILESKKILIEDLSNKKLVVDSYNMLYQFLTTIRQQDGTLLMDSKGRVTSHISGLFFRVTQLLKNNIKLAFVFDGTAPKLKQEEKERRKAIKETAKEKYQVAANQENVADMHKFASRTATLTAEMVTEAKELIECFGQPIIQAPSEGEAQASYMSKKGEFFAVISQDTDGLLFGSPKIIKNVSVSLKRKILGSTAYKTTQPELLDLAENLKRLGIDNKQLIVIAMLCGTDFNRRGIYGIGPKKALKLVKQHENNFDKLFEEAKWNDFFNITWQEIFDTIINMPVTDDYNLEWKQIDKDKLHEIMVDKYEFSQERIDKVIEDIGKKQTQKGLGEFF